MIVDITSKIIVVVCICSVVFVETNMCSVAAEVETIARAKFDAKRILL